MNDRNRVFFNERSDEWIRIYRGLTIVMFFLLIVAGFVGGIVMTSEFENGWMFFAFFIGGSLLGFLQLVVNMLFIQLLNNVQEIRKKLESGSDRAPAEPDELPDF